MNKRTKKIMSAAVSLLLCLIMLTGMIPNVFANEAPSAQRTAVTARDLAFALPAAENNLTVYANDLLKMLFPSLTLTNAESDYMKENFFSLTYNASVPSDTVQTVYHKDTGVLDVRVSVYSYTAENGSVVRWIPKKAIIGDVEQELALDGDAYVCNFSDLYRAEEDFDMDVVFSWTVTLPENVVEMLLLQSRYDGVVAEDALKKHQEELKQYNDALAAYQACIKYAQDRAARDQYEKELAQYQLDKVAYENYLVKKQVYDTQKKAYDDYLAEVKAYEDAWAEYEIYKKFLEDYGQQYADYLVYEQQIEAVLAKLRVMDLMYVADSREWRFSSGLLGELVNMVIANRAELEKVGYTGGDAVASSTLILRQLVKEYIILRDDRGYPSKHERYKTLYGFYCTHYEEFLNNFKQLYDALKLLYGNDAVVEYIETKGKGEHFRQFLAQLYVIKCCFDDGEKISLEWTPHTRLNKTLEQVLEPCHLLPDDVKADPSLMPYPEVEVKKVEPPDVDQVVPPEGPPAVVFPPEEDEPKAVEKPTEPAFVADPGEAPEQVAHPGNIPPTHTLTQTQLQWANDYRAINYTVREALVGEQTLSLETTMTRNVSIDNLFRVSFYTHDGKQIGESQYFHHGDNANGIRYPAVPTRENTAQYTYRFCGWRLFNGEEREGSVITSDISMMATYEEQIRFYEVAWEVDGVLLEAPKTYAYGALPSPTKYVPNVKTDNYREYVFSGWSPSIEPVTGNVTYRGFYTEAMRYYTVTWVLDGGDRIETQSVLAGTVPIYTGNKDYVKNSYRYRFSHWSSTPSIVGGNVTYEAVYHQGTPLTTDADGTVSSVEISSDVIAVKVKQSIALQSLSDYANVSEKDILLHHGDMSVRISNEAIQTLLQNSCMRIGFTAEEKDGRLVYTLGFYNIAGRSLDIPIPVTLMYDYSDGTSGVPLCYRVDGDSTELLEGIRASGVLNVEQIGGGKFLPQMEYYLRFESVANCNTLKLPTQAAVGTWIDFNLATCVYGYEIKGAVLTYANGDTETLDTLGFEMREEVTAVSLLVERVIYRVSFVVDGAVIETKEYFMGEEIARPADPTLDKGDGTIYTFSGWSPHVTLAIGDNRELVYTAQFFASHAVTLEELRAQETNAITKRLILLAVIVILLIAVVVLSIVFRKRIAAVTVRVVRWIAKKIRR